MQNNNLTFEKLNQLLQSWQDHAPDKAFGGMTLAEFRVKVQPSFASRVSIETAKQQRRNAENLMADSDAEALRLVQLVVNAIKGDPETGDDSSLYEAAGYVRRSERKSGLSRSSKKTAPPPAPAT